MENLKESRFAYQDFQLLWLCESWVIKSLKLYLLFCYFGSYFFWSFDTQLIKQSKAYIFNLFYHVG